MSGVRREGGRRERETTRKEEGRTEEGRREGRPTSRTPELRELHHKNLATAPPPPPASRPPAPVSTTTTTTKYESVKYDACNMVMDGAGGGRTSDGRSHGHAHARAVAKTRCKLEPKYQSRVFLQRELSCHSLTPLGRTDGRTDADGPTEGSRRCRPSSF